MAMLTLQSERAIVLVVLFMATDTGGSQHQFGSYRPTVTTNTFNFLVLVVQFEIGLVMVKVPVFPITGVMAGITSRAESPLVHILLFVTGHTIGFGFLELNRQMTFLTFDQYVLPDKREARHRMVEFSLLPRLFMMARFAFLAFLSFMLVIFLMTGETIGFQLVFVQIALMTSDAFGVAMLAE